MSLNHRGGIDKTDGYDLSQSFLSFILPWKRSISHKLNHLSISTTLDNRQHTRKQLDSYLHPGTGNKVILAGNTKQVKLVPTANRKSKAKSSNGKI